jgi:uncharacterized protein (DUF1499 family)
MYLPRRIYVMVLLLSSIRALTPSQPVERADTRRAFLAAFLSSSALPQVAVAFDNRLDNQFLDRTPSTGTQPENLGVKTRISSSIGNYVRLAPCDGRPNCWCSSTPFQDNRARYIDTWKPNGRTIGDLKRVVDTYEVGQQGVDGGGFQVMEYDEAKQYIYVQFQSYKYGYIDDVEFWLDPDTSQFDVRSASRLGQSDLGVNAKRLEYIGGRLENEFGWKLNRRKNGSLV